MTATVIPIRDLNLEAARLAHAQIQLVEQLIASAELTLPTCDPETAARVREQIARLRALNASL